MNRFRQLCAAIAAGAITVAVAAGDATPSASQSPPTGASNAMVERGRYLVSITGCHDCHSPKTTGMTPDLSRGLSGRPASTPVPTATKNEVHASLDLTAWTGPWGQSVASNLTPDPTTGLGNRYTEASFIQTMRTGRKPNGTPVMPPMPAEVYQNMADDDLRAIWAYLRTVKPIRNAVFSGLTAPGAAAK